MNQSEAVDKILNLIKDQTTAYIPTKTWEEIKLHLGYAYAIGFDEGRGQNSHRKPILQIKDGKIIHTFDSVSDAARRMKVNKTSISKVASENGRNKTCKGFKWKYKNETI
jgi:hypothetical protein